MHQCVDFYFVLERLQNVGRFYYTILRPLFLNLSFDISISICFYIDIYIFYILCLFGIEKFKIHRAVKLRLPDFVTTAQDGGEVVSLTHRPPLPAGNVPGTHFC